MERAISPDAGLSEEAVREKYRALSREYLRLREHMNAQGQTRDKRHVGSHGPFPAYEGWYSVIDGDWLLCADEATAREYSADAAENGEPSAVARVTEINMPGEKLVDEDVLFGVTRGVDYPATLVRA